MEMFDDGKRQRQLYFNFINCDSDSAISPRKKPNRNQFVTLSFGVDPLNWQSFIEITEMACNTNASCSCGHALKPNR